MQSHITGKVLMVRPVCFGYNEETAVNNYYQKKDKKSVREIQEEALEEFDTMVEVLRRYKIEVIVFFRITGFPVMKTEALFCILCLLKIED